ncbi:MAG: hypothetical protein GEV28_31925 [Actinophytocola sp.]|uniref:hypothetical protein n=1 Tax=Actinophytocola sp. TaxID=1872138 RepID=UPI00132C2623|nr:hypothetical protein [Actinophytocola sp.]MPZ84745.1 hypothetical protein [Actinophytocola sp.]
MVHGSGMQLCAWVKVDGGADIEYDICGGEVELSFGGRFGDFQLHATEDGLAELIATTSAALDEMRAGAAGE